MSDNRMEIVCVRLSDAELQKLNKDAAAAKLSRSDYIRKCVVAKGKP